MKCSNMLKNYNTFLWKSQKWEKKLTTVNGIVILILKVNLETKIGQANLLERMDK